jgi:methylated-DNA-[protein]-cysteine S-methyltransferase
MSDFSTRVLAAVRRIPAGRVATYGDVAAAAGRPRAARAVGNIMRGCSRPDVPCHRVVAAAGRLGGYGGNLEMKRALLRAEGLQVSGSAIREFRRRRFSFGSRRTPARSERRGTGRT